MFHNKPMGSFGTLSSNQAAIGVAEAGLTTGLNVAFSETGIPVGSIVGAIISLFSGGPKAPPPVNAWVQGNIDASGNFTYTVTSQSGTGDPNQVIQPMQAAATAAVAMVAQLGGVWNAPVQWGMGYGAGVGSDGQTHSGWSASGAGIGQNSGLGLPSNVGAAGSESETAATQFFANPPMADWVARMTLGAMLLQQWNDPNMLAILGGPSQVAAVYSNTGIAPTTAIEVQTIVNQASAYYTKSQQAELSAETAAAQGPGSSILQTTAGGSSMLTILAYGAIAFLAWDFLEGKKNVSR